MAQKTQSSPLRAVWQAGASQTPGQPSALHTALCVPAIPALSAMPSQQAPGPATGSQKVDGQHPTLKYTSGSNVLE